MRWWAGWWGRRSRRPELERRHLVAARHDSLVSQQGTAVESHHSDVRIAAGSASCSGFSVMGLLYALLRNWKPRTVNAVFGKAQMFSAMGMGLMHGTNDAQKTMGIVALALGVRHGGRAAGESAGVAFISACRRRRSRGTAWRSPRGSK